MKKFKFFILILLISISLSSCKKNNDEDDNQIDLDFLSDIDTKSIYDHKYHQLININDSQNNINLLLDSYIDSNNFYLDNSYINKKIGDNNLELYGNNNQTYIINNDDNSKYNDKLNSFLLQTEFNINLLGNNDTVDELIKYLTVEATSKNIIPTYFEDGKDRMYIFDLDINYLGQNKTLFNNFYEVMINNFYKLENINSTFKSFKVELKFSRKNLSKATIAAFDDSSSFNYVVEKKNEINNNFNQNKVFSNGNLKTINANILDNNYLLFDNNDLSIYLKGHESLIFSDSNYQNLITSNYPSNIYVKFISHDFNKLLNSFNNNFTLKSSYFNKTISYYNGYIVYEDDLIYFNNNNDYYVFDEDSKTLYKDILKEDKFNLDIYQNIKIDKLINFNNKYFIPNLDLTITNKGIYYEDDLYNFVETKDYSNIIKNLSAAKDDKLLNYQIREGLYILKEELDNIEVTLFLNTGTRRTDLFTFSKFENVNVIYPTNYDKTYIQVESSVGNKNINIFIIDITKGKYIFFSDEVSMYQDDIYEIPSFELLGYKSSYLYNGHKISNLDDLENVLNNVSENVIRLKEEVPFNFNDFLTILKNHHLKFEMGDGLIDYDLKYIKNRHYSSSVSYVYDKGSYYLLYWDDHKLEPSFKNENKFNDEDIEDEYKLIEKFFNLNNKMPSNTYMEDESLYFVFYEDNVEIKIDKDRYGTYLSLTNLFNKITYQYGINDKRDIENYTFSKRINIEYEDGNYLYVQTNVNELKDSLLADLSNEAMLKSDDYRYDWYYYLDREYYDLIFKYEYNNHDGTKVPITNNMTIYASKQNREIYDVVLMGGFSTNISKESDIYNDTLKFSFKENPNSYIEMTINQIKNHPVLNKIFRFKVTKNPVGYNNYDYRIDVYIYDDFSPMDYKFYNLK